LGKFWRVLQWYVFMAIWCIFPRFGMLHQEKSVNPANMWTALLNTYIYFERA
jgi:hypothetical protein